MRVYTIKLRLSSSSPEFTMEDVVARTPMEAIRVWVGTGDGGLANVKKGVRISAHTASGGCTTWMAR